MERGHFGLMGLDSTIVLIVFNMSSRNRPLACGLYSQSFIKMKIFDLDKSQGMC
jgi:hypothetical protein